MDTTTTHRGRADYYDRQERRRERLEVRAERLQKEAARLFRKGDLREEFSGIPFGQPILVGHHSEKRHRRAIEKANNATRRAIEADKAAGQAAATAANIGANGVISSDAPDAIELLREKLAGMEAKQAKMTEANKLVRRKDVAGLVALGWPESLAVKAITVPVWGSKFCAYEPYQLSNNSANIKRVKDRIAMLEREEQREPAEVLHNSGVRVVQNVDENRVQLFFPGKPDEATRTMLKQRGFRWAPTEGAWQRQLNNAAVYAAQYVLEKLTG